MVVAVLIVLHCPLLDTFRRDGQGNVDPAVRFPRRGQHRQLHGIERRTGISVGRIGKERPSIRVNVGMEGSHALGGVRQRPVNELRDVLR